MSPRIVLIGPADGLTALRGRFDAAADVQTFTDSEALEALDHIIRTKPAMVALQGEFSATSRGTAMINRIKDDPSLAACEVSVLVSHNEMSRIAVKHGAGGGAAVAIEEPKPALDQRGTRRAARVPITVGIELSIDGSPAALVDLSMVGAQVVSSTLLKPNQRVRVVLADSKATIRCNGLIAWAAFEMPNGMPTRYRAGIDWGMTAEAAAIEAFAKLHQRL